MTPAEKERLIREIDQGKERLKALEGQNDTFSEIGRQVIVERIRDAAHKLRDRQW